MSYGRDVKIIQELIEDAVQHNMDQDKGLLGIYEALWCNVWFKVMTKHARPLSSVVLDMNIAE